MDKSPVSVRDAYWTIYRNGAEVEVFDEIKDRPIRRLSKAFTSEADAERYIAETMEKYKKKIAIFERI